MNDETRAWLQGLFANPVPRDVVPGSGLTLQDLRRQSGAAGTWAEVNVPGEVLLDADGIPNGMTPPHTETVYRGGTVISRADLDRLGLTEADLERDYPGVSVAPNNYERTI